MNCNWKLMFLSHSSFVVGIIVLIVIYSTYVNDKIFDQIPDLYKSLWRQKLGKFLKEEQDFPLAFSLIVYRDMDQVERLLRAIYRPFNFYCIHIDTKSGDMNYRFIWNLTQIYENVIMPEILIPVWWSNFSVLEADLLCMKALLHLSKKWKYFINLTGQEWPLKTNLELVRILRVLNGSNMVNKARTIPGRVPPNVTVPFNLHLWHGDVHIVVCRAYVDFLLNNPQIRLLILFLKKHTSFPDELLFSTVSHSHKLRPPGGYAGYLILDKEYYPQLTRYKLWSGSICYGILQRHICIFGPKDIPAMITTSVRQLFANKFVKGINDVMLNFMEDWFIKRSELVYKYSHLNPFIDLDYYRRLPQVKDHW